MNARAAYLAGIIDADGHIAWRSGRYNTPIVGVTSTSESLIAWLHSHVGGSTSRQRRACPTGCTEVADGHIHRRETILRWQITGERACIVLRNVRPFLVVKGIRADRVLEQFEQHLRTMSRPARRRHHIAKERAAMARLGWEITP